MLVISVIIVKQKIFVNNRKEHNALRGEDEVTYMEWKNFYYLLAVEKRIGEMCFILSDDEKKQSIIWDIQLIGMNLIGLDTVISKMAVDFRQ